MSKSQNVHVLAAVYPNREHAETILEMLHGMHRATTITLVDAALVTKNEDGKIKVEESKELTVRKGARRGALITGVLGVIYPPSLIASVVTGGAIGALAGRLRDTGIKQDQLKEIADGLTPGKAAVIVLADDASTLKVQGALGSYEGTLMVGAIDEQVVKELEVKEVFEQASNSGG